MKSSRNFARESMEGIKDSGSEVEEERSLSVREVSIRLTKSSSGRRVTASFSVSEGGV